jgi:hypothetical protein
VCFAAWEGVGSCSAVVLRTKEGLRIEIGRPLAISKRPPSDFGIENTRKYAPAGRVDAQWNRPHPEKPVVVRKNKSHRLSGLLQQAILMMQAAKHRLLDDVITRGHVCGRWPEPYPGWPLEFQDLVRSEAGPGYNGVPIH